MEIIFVWELCNVEKVALYVGLYCMRVNFVLWDNCALFGGHVMCVIVLDVRVVLSVSCVSGCVVGYSQVVLYVVCVVYGLCGVRVGLYAACIIC